MGKMNSPIIRNWEHPDVHKYEETIALKIPGYYQLYDMLDRLLTSHWGERQSANVLIVGAGGGQEIVTLGERHNTWHFTGVDPSKRMLELASQRIELAGLESQSTLVQAELHEAAPDQLYDAATCMLVLHFVQGLEQKKQMLHQIASRLLPGAPFFIATINGDVNTESWFIQMRAWKSHMLDHGISRQEWELFESSIGVESHPITGLELESLLQEAGFCGITRYFGSYLIEGWFAFKKESVESL